MVVYSSNLNPCICVHITHVQFKVFKPVPPHKQRHEVLAIFSQVSRKSGSPDLLLLQLNFFPGYLHTILSLFDTTLSLSLTHMCLQKSKTNFRNSHKDREELEKARSIGGLRPLHHLLSDLGDFWSAVSSG